MCRLARPPLSHFVLENFTEALVSGLTLPDDSHASDAGLKTEILKGRKSSTYFKLIVLAFLHTFYMQCFESSFPNIW